MSLWTFIISVGAAGLVGGLFNAYFATGGFELPRIERVSGRTILLPGFFGNVLIGAFVALILAALYGPLGELIIGGPGTTPTIPLTLRSLGGAALSGFGGARLLSQEVDRRYAQGAAANMSEALQTLVKKDPPRGGAN